jgi:hypothetical protein
MKTYSVTVSGNITVQAESAEAARSEAFADWGRVIQSIGIEEVQELPNWDWKAAIDNEEANQ